MVTKYVRERFQDGASGGYARGTVQSPGLRMTPKQRLLIIYICITLFSIVLFAAYVAGLVPRGGWGPAVEGEGIVTEKVLGKSFLGAEAYILSVSFGEAATWTVEGETSYLGRLAMDRESWDLVSLGQRVQVRYQHERSGERIRILRVTLVE